MNDILYVLFVLLIIAVGVLIIGKDSEFWDRDDER